MHALRGVIFSLRKLKYMANKKSFKRALKPYDVQDLVESYSAGHADLVLTVKQLKKNVTRIEKGLNLLIDLHTEDKTRGHFKRGYSDSASDNMTREQ